MNTLFLIDASGFLYRSYFAIRNMTNSKGESTNALFGFIRSVQKLRKDFPTTHIASVFDGPHNTKARDAMYADYKAHRQSMPGDLLYQILWAQHYCDLAGIPKLSIPEVEADDAMGSIAVWAAELGVTVYLCTSDKDFGQLVNDKILMLNTHKENLILDARGVEESFGVPPKLMIDYLAITGDASDNVPGLSGFGPKTAAQLLKQFGSLDYILDHPEEVPGVKKQETIRQQKDQALLSRRLVTIIQDVPVPKTMDFYALKTPNFDPLREFYSNMNFHTLIKELEPSTPAAADIPLDYRLVDDEQAFKDMLENLESAKEIAIDTETTDIQPLKAELVGIGLGVKPGQAWYVPLNGTLGKDYVLSHLKPFIESSKRSFFGHNIKYDLHVLSNSGIKIKNICFDTLLASWVLNSHSRQHSLDILSLEHFNKVKIPISDLIGKGKNQITMKEVPLERVSNYCCEDIDYTVRLKELLENQLKERKMEPLFRSLELPLLSVLTTMEKNGIFLDSPYLNDFSKEITAHIKELEQQIYELAGHTFNLNSPKQLSETLTDKLMLKLPKKTATGYSTSADVLEGMRHLHPVIDKILDYRTTEKLRSTYVDSLPGMTNPKTQRIHCTFNQSVTATGRLSCQDPNLQNIPVRTEQGRRIREAFRPQRPGWSFLAADYSQIELRLLAHLSEDPTLIDAFNKGEDIHAHTAATVLGIPITEVTPEQRYQAKAVNFGIIYGQQAFGLSQELGIEVKEAAAFIETYFQRYGKVKKFLEHCKEEARRTGKAMTSTGRERAIPEINSKNPHLRNAAERLALNTPLQGTAADIIKLAMLKVQEWIEKEQKLGMMVLQIHDELIFEVPDFELSLFELAVREKMEQVYRLKVPLVVNISIGKNWKEC